VLSKRTVFVLGAGAHCSYGFPSGEKLKQEVATLIERDAHIEDDIGFSLLPGYGAAKLEEVQLERRRAFATALQNAGQASIDAFLNCNRHQPGFDVIGKAAIAQLLLRYEANARLGGDDDWIDYLFQILLDGIKSPDEFHRRNGIAFVTFNYDRFLEKSLTSKVKHSFGLHEEEALALIAKIPIIHMYGTLGAFPFSASGSRSEWVQATLGIRTIFDTEKNDDLISQAKHLLEEAQVVCFLGFGFHRENIELLGLPASVKSAAVVGSSRFGITDAEYSRYLRLLPGIQVIPAYQDRMCRRSLRELPLF